ncbi:hypothetical protein FQN60_017105 [Etheostoma spectabile]|uniref:Ig-like domain-containing protein n=1 Tax=Etheostoma spectabile TaxID=54343 RepID=A0A5J5DEI2_9PERO|nr:hypothetical protein FQN60_017105 [Etheostoma spectabile]
MVVVPGLPAGGASYRLSELEPALFGKEVSKCYYSTPLSVAHSISYTTSHCLLLSLSAVRVSLLPHDYVVRALAVDYESVDSQRAAKASMASEGMSDHGCLEMEEVDEMVPGSTNGDIPLASEGLILRILLVTQVSIYGPTLSKWTWPIGVSQNKGTIDVQHQILQPLPASPPPLLPHIFISPQCFYLPSLELQGLWFKEGGNSEKDWERGGRKGQVCSGAVTVKVTSKVEVLKGDTAKLPCTYTVSPPSSNTVVEWYIEEQGTRKRVAFTQGGQGKSDDGTLLSGRVTIGQDFTLTISSVQPSDELVFYCQVTAGPAGVGDAATMLKVFFAPEKPELTKPSSQAITAGETTSSEIGTCVTSNGHPQPRIIWFKDDQPLPEVKDRKEKTYMIPSVVKESSGLSTVKSTLYMQPTKADKDSVFKCTVEYSMPGDQIKQKIPVKEGDTVTMKCETDGNPQPEFDFTKDGKATSGQGSLLILKSVKRTDGDIDPVSVSPAQPQVVILGDKVEWQCKTKASAGHTIQWKKGSEVLSQDGTLSLQNVSYDKAGEYMCVGAVPSVPGLTAQASVNLTVKGKPMIDTPAVEEVGKEGDMVTLKCSAYGSPAPQFTWKPSGKESVLLEGNKVVSTVTLQATAAVMKDGATCEVSNQYGTDSKTFVVSLKRAIDNSADRADKQQGGSSGVVIAVVVCVLLLLLMVALIYFLNKKSKLPCSKKDKKEVASGEVNSDIVVEMKTDKANEEAVMKQDSKSNRQRDEGKKENSYEDNRAHFYKLHKTGGDNKRYYDYTVY